MTFLFKGQPYDLTNDHELTSFLDQLVIIYDQSSTPEAKNVLFQDLTLAEATVLPPLPYPKIIQLGHIAGLRVLLNLKKMHHTHFRARLNSALFNYYGSVSLLHCAASFGHCDIIEALIKDYGYNPFIEGYNFDSLDYSNSLLKTAEEGGHAEAIALISNTEQLIKLRNAYLNNNPLEE